MSAQPNNGKLAVRLVGVVVFMGMMSYAAVPFYNWFCRVTGFGGVTNVAARASDKVLDQTIKVRFDASLERDMPWEFKPVERTMEIRIGETGLTFYEAHNPTDRVIAGTASYNVTPFAAGYFFTKIDCFCFELQVLQPGETVMMPVTFYVDPDITEDADGKYVNTITLSYTFHETELSQDEVSLVQTQKNPLN